MLVNSLVKILAEHGRHQSNLFLTIKDAVPRLAFKLNWLVLILWPNRKVKELEWQEVVKNGKFVVFSHSWGFELLKV